MENSCKKILVLGSGLMTESLVTALLRNPNVSHLIFSIKSTLLAILSKMLRN